MTDAFAEKTAAWPMKARATFNELRALILCAGREMDAGAIDESLKWGQPAWRPRTPRQGSTLRADWSEKSPQSIALFVDCKTTLCATMREFYPTEFTYENDRALRLPLDAPLPVQAIDHLARLTFAYHRKR